MPRKNRAIRVPAETEAALAEMFPGKHERSQALEQWVLEGLAHVSLPPKVGRAENITFMADRGHVRTLQRYAEHYSLTWNEVMRKAFDELVQRADLSNALARTDRTGNWTSNNDRTRVHFHPTPAQVADLNQLALQGFKVNNVLRAAVRSLALSDSLAQPFEKTRRDERRPMVMISIALQPVIWPLVDVRAEKLGRPPTEVLRHIVQKRTAATERGIAERTSLKVTPRPITIQGNNSIVRFLREFPPPERNAFVSRCIHDYIDLVRKPADFSRPRERMAVGAYVDEETFARLLEIAYGEGRSPNDAARTAVGMALEHLGHDVDPYIPPAPPGFSSSLSL